MKKQSVKKTKLIGMVVAALLIAVTLAAVFAGTYAWFVVTPSSSLTYHIPARGTLILHFEPSIDLDEGIYPCQVRHNLVQQNAFIHGNNWAAYGNEFFVRRANEVTYTAELWIHTGDSLEGTVDLFIDASAFVNDDTVANPRDLIETGELWVRVVVSGAASGSFINNGRWFLARPDEAIFITVTVRLVVPDVFSAEDLLQGSLNVVISVLSPDIDEDY
jgi:hypothetical protein